MFYYYSSINSYGRHSKKCSNTIGDKQVNSFVKFSVIEVHFNNYQTGDGD